MEKRKKKRRKLERKEQSVDVFKKIAKERYAERIKKKKTKLERESKVFLPLR